MEANTQYLRGFREVVPDQEEVTQGRLWEAAEDSERCRRYRWDLSHSTTAAVMTAKEKGDVNLNTPVFSLGGSQWTVRLVTRGDAWKISLDLRDTSRPRTFDAVRWNMEAVLSLKSARGHRNLQENGGFPAIGTMSILISDDDDVDPDDAAHLTVTFELRLEPDTSHRPRIDELACDLKQLHLSSDASDAIVRVKGRDFPVHRCIMGARTPVFASMFRHEMSERETGLVVIDDCEPETFRRFLQYVYSGEVEDLDPANASALYEVADKYQVDELKADCLEALKKGLSVDSFCITLAFARMHLETELLGLVAEFFSENVTQSLLKMDWQQFLAQHPNLANELRIQSLLPQAPPRQS